MEKTHSQICTRCVMDTSDLGISFTSEGLCNHCIEFLDKRNKYTYKGTESDVQLDKIIARIKEAGKGREYDCVIGLSGGVDSSYAAKICIDQGLRILAVHLDNGWNSEEAVSNIKNVARKLSIDFESYVLNWDEFKDLQLSFLKASVPEADTPTDIAILAALHKVAAKYNIKSIISGGNFATEGILPETWHYNAKDLTYFNYIHKKFGNRRLKSFPTFGFMRELYYKIFKGIKMIYILNYVPYIKNDAISLLENQLSWKNYGGKHYESKYTGFIQSYYLYHKFGIDYRRATLSSQICTGEISREDALEILKLLPYKMERVEEEMKYIAKKLEISKGDFQNILDAESKWYFDYPNDQKRLNFIYNLYRRIFRKEKLGNF